MNKRRNSSRGNRRLIIVLIALLAILVLEAAIILFMSGNHRSTEPVAEVTQTPISSEVPAESPTVSPPTPTPEVTPEPTLTPEPTPTPTPEKTEIPKNGFKVAIDAGHQLHADSGMEPVGPGASETKYKVSSGTSGVSTGVPEYQLNLDIAKKLKKILVKRGYDVYMIRTKNEVSITNIERAQAANNSGADISLRIHADGVDDSSVHGASVLFPSENNPYVSKLSAESKKLSQCVLDAYCAKTGFSSRGLYERDDLTGTNWSEIPVALIEMGFMSNASEDEMMQEKSVQKKMAEGIADGIDTYFGI